MWMKKRDGVRKALNEIEERYIEEAGETKLRQQPYSAAGQGKRRLTGYVLAAALVLLILVIGTVQIIKRQEQTGIPDPTQEGTSLANNTETESTGAERTTDEEADSTSGETEDVPAGIYRPEEPVTLKVVDAVNSFCGEQTGWFAEVLKERFNVTLEIVNMMDETALEEGDIILWAAEGENYREAVADGILLDWNENDLLTIYGSYLQTHLADALEANAQMNGGVVYGFAGDGSEPGSVSADQQIYTWDMRWDLYEALGTPDVESLEDEIQLLKAMKELEPVDDEGRETYALSLWSDWDDGTLLCARLFAAGYEGYEALGVGFYDGQTGALQGVLEEQGVYYEALQFFNRLYRENLLDPDSKNQTIDQAMQKAASGSCLSSIVNYMGQKVYNTEEHLAQNQMMCALVPAAAEPMILVQPTLGTGYQWSIGAGTQYPELCMELINWLATPEGTLTLLYGPQGICWDYDEEDALYLTELGLQCVSASGTSMNTAGYEGTFTDGAFQSSATIWNRTSYIPDDVNDQSFWYQRWSSTQTETECEEEASWRAYTGSKNTDEYLRSLENGAYTLNTSNVRDTAIGFAAPGQQDDLYATWEQVCSVITERSWDCIYADTEEEFQSCWADLVSESAAAGYASCLEYSKEQAEKYYEAEQRYK
jgi:multiple sugar transport system substrate-binding protein/putative aldouronate transport system substrate-binding protein